MNAIISTRRGISRRAASSHDFLTRQHNVRARSEDSERRLKALENAYWIALLEEKGVRLGDAADHYLKHVLPFSQSPDIGTAVADYLRHVGKELSPTYLQSARATLERFAQEHQGLRLCEVQREHVEQFLGKSYNEEAVSPSTRNTRQGRLQAFFGWCRERRFCSTNPCREIKRARLRSGEPEYYTAEQCSAILEHARKYQILRLVSVQLFGGARPEEAACLASSDVQEADGRIIFRGKTGRRVVPITETLAAWLAAAQAEPWAEGYLSVKRRLVRLFNDAGVSRIYDGLRHTAASVCAAIHGSTAASELLGHSSLSTARRHYIGLMTKAEAVKIEALRPTTPANVIQFRAA